MGLVMASVPFCSLVYWRSLRPRVRNSAQYSVTAKMQKAAVIAATRMASMGMTRSLHCPAAIMLEEAGRHFDFDQIKIRQESRRRPGTGQCDIRVGMVMEPRMPRVAPPSMNS